MIIVITVFLLIYVVSTLLIYWYFKLAYSEKGIFNLEEPDEEEIFITFTPIVNTVGILFLWIANYPIHSNHRIESFIIRLSKKLFK